LRDLNLAGRQDRLRLVIHGNSPTKLMAQTNAPS
jgi:hypothetical protein